MKVVFAAMFFLSAVSLLMAQTAQYKVDPAASNVTFEVSAQLHMVHGKGGVFSGTISGDPADITAAQISVHLDPATFDTDNDSRDKTMREKCLELAKYPSIGFESTSIEAEKKALVSDQPLSATIKGVLKLHGLETPMAVPVKIVWNSAGLTAEGSMALKLDDYKISRPRVIFVKLQNDISIRFKIVARKESAATP